MKFLGWLQRSLKGVSAGMGTEVKPEVWKAPVIHVAAMCAHITGDRHRFIVLDLNPLARDLAGEPGTSGWVPVVPLGGIQVGAFGIVLKGFAAIDVEAVMRNVLWEDEHCMVCCGALLKFVEPIAGSVMTRCGPTIGPRGGEGPSVVGSVVDEYWTD